MTVQRFVSRKLIRRCLSAALLFLVFAYGILVGKQRVFPYELIVSANQMVRPSPFESTTHRQRRAELFAVVAQSNVKPSVGSVTGLKVVFLGDSHTEFGAWNATFPNKAVFNRGIHEDTTADAINRLDSILALNPSQVFVMLGVNDIVREIELEAIVNNYGQLIDTLKKHGIEVIVQSTVQCHESRCGRDKIEAINALNVALETLSNKRDVRFLSLGDLSSSQGLATSLTYDGIHLTPEGYAIWVDALTALSD